MKTSSMMSSMISSSLVVELLSDGFAHFCFLRDISAVFAIPSSRWSSCVVRFARHSTTHDQANRVIGFVMSLMSKFVQKNSQASLNLSPDVLFCSEKNMLRDMTTRTTKSDIN